MTLKILFVAPGGNTWPFLKWPPQKLSFQVITLNKYK